MKAEIVCKGEGVLKNGHHPCPLENFNRTQTKTIRSQTSSMKWHSSKLFEFSGFQYIGTEKSWEKVSTWLIHGSIQHVLFPSSPQVRNIKFMNNKTWFSDFSRFESKYFSALTKQSVKKRFSLPTEGRCTNLANGKRSRMNRRSNVFYVAGKDVNFYAKRSCFRQLQGHFSLGGILRAEWYFLLSPDAQSPPIGL